MESDAMAQKRMISRSDILPPAEYARDRKARRQAIVAVKSRRRVEVGPIATFYFESYDTMWHQVHEMLHIERGGEAQIEDELGAYNPLIPQGSELVATVMLEIEDPVRRARVLSQLGGIDRHMFISIGDQTIRAVAEGDIERTREDGKTSSVHFVRFPFTADQVARFRSGEGQVILGFDHPAYAHMAVMPPAVRTELATDFD